MSVVGYTGDPVFDTALGIGFAIAAVTAVAACFIETPYGRFADKSYGVSLDPRLGWFLMELPASLAFVYFFFRGQDPYAPFALFVLFVWVVHYANRGFVMPALMRVPVGQKSSFSLMVVVIGWVVTSLHGYLSATFAATFAAREGFDWFTDPRFIVGVSIYYAAFFANLHSDHVVRNLRTKEEVAAGIKAYRVPQGGLFRYVSSPSYLTELAFWAGFALFTWSLPGLYILLVSAANLVPRAISTDAWYRERFPNYPPERKILIPWVW
ncbi:MAG: 3-oxo-5-alpha-steroid 4-dehydrogenase [bacterium]|nr:3-oxo-5-alpha-steroid 4-dehydrogenase [bacterium]